MKKTLVSFLVLVAFSFYATDGITADAVVPVDPVDNTVVAEKAAFQTAKVEAKKKVKKTKKVNKVNKAKKNKKAKKVKNEEPKL